MPSSTSSSSRPVPGGPWGSTWALALAVAIGTILWCEHALRARGFRPSVVDDKVLWAMTRRQVDDGSEHTIALLGSSRMQLGYSPDELAKDAPGYKAVQLAIDGSSPLGTLIDLADDEDFHGIAVCDIAEWEMGRDRWSSQAEYVEQYHRLLRAPGKIANRWLAGLAQEHLALLEVGGREILDGLRRHRWPDAPWVITRRDRTRLADYSLAAHDALEAKRVKNLAKLPATAVAPERWLVDALALDDAVARIQARGGKVVFIRMPTSGEHWRRSNAMYPRDRYWDRFAARTKAIAIHFQDVPAMAKLTCADEIHLDMRDAPTFTRALVDALRTRGVITP